MADRAEDNKAPTRNAPNSDREPRRPRGPDDRLALPHRDEMNRKTVPGRESAAPSWSAPVANRITATESPTPTTFNRFLQQNRPKADSCTAAKWLFDHLVSASRKSGWDFQSECFCGLQVDN